MLRFAACALLWVVLCTSTEARQRHYVVSSECNITMPCEGVSLSRRGLRVVKAMGGFGSARQVYIPPTEPITKNVRQRRSERPRYAMETIISHPDGCPARLFCGCGAAVRLFGKPVRDLWLASNWLKFPRSAPAPRMAAVSRHHVFVLERHIEGSIWLVYDANSGGGATRIHARSIAGYVIVAPRI